MYSLLEKIAKREIEQDPIAFIRENSFIGPEDNDDKIKEENMEEDKELKLDNFCDLIGGESNNTLHFKKKPVHVIQSE